ncbi:4'-phosphopantetheinyl transferase superfamily protein [Lysobacter pythonis]|uniref:4'-phosphopantetheinyl transferase superfamily protein n=1 Tax=Solilutibacter pythonis TaxID=2483112 RepID=A0A3M2I5J4_9GAMM|nr:4'-phosphopantetheinyl transferase superfamily protein [Lysobacter pythonis]RMH93737.1 4'-phosphopantetheinyl transferase superfamily protein [Lysobacter pythonis]
MSEIPAHVFLPHRPGQPAEPLARAWLATHWARDADSLPLLRDHRGRPRLGPPMSDFDAGWSHSGAHLLIAAAHGLRLGCDLERARPRPNALALARRFFHPRESQWLGDLPAAALDTAFLRLWCAKEAVLKAHGHGLSFGLEKLCFGDRAGRLTLLECDTRLGDARDWRLHEFVPAEGYLATIAWQPIDPPPAILPP